jgi:hypothetical protein
MRKDLLTIAFAAAAEHVPVNQLDRALSRAGIDPELYLNGTAYYCADKVVGVASALRQNTPRPSRRKTK